MTKSSAFQIFKQKHSKNAVKFLAGTFIVGGALISSCGGGSSYEENNLKATQGIITFMEEVDSNDFKITNEVVVTRREDSKIITTNLDGTVDTLSLDRARAIDTTSTRGRSYHRTFYGGMFGYMIGRSLGSPLNRSSYSSSSAYSNSSSRTSSMRTAVRSSVSKPKSSFGSGKSFKSFGG